VGVGPMRVNDGHCTRKAFLTQIIPIYIPEGCCYRVHLAGLRPRLSSPTTQ
jgi:hypothetical protein